MKINFHIPSSFIIMDYSVEEEIIKDFFDKIKYLVLPSEANNYKSKFLQSNVLLYCVVFLFVFKVIIVVIPINFPQNIFFADITKSSLESFVNQTRQSLGLSALKENEKLNQAAQFKAENMVQEQYFAHTSPSGITPWYWFSKAGYNYKYAGENLAIGFFESEEVYNAWLNSASHKANIISPNYTEVGTAVLGGFGSNNTIVVVQEFGSRAVVKTNVTKGTNPTPIATTTPKTNLTPEVTEPVIISTPATNTKAVTTPKSENVVSVNETEKVLSQSIESQTILESVKSGSSDIYYKFMNSILYSYDGILQNVIYGISFIVISILLTLIFFNFNVSFKRDLIFRSVLLIVLLSAATLLNKEIIISFIPHQIIV